MPQSTIQGNHKQQRIRQDKTTTKIPITQEVNTTQRCLSPVLIFKHSS
ncbi:hypothetical protein HMPREF9419_1035 [Prevotella nigrescens ATCC 33563]|nr:hypothetical protein HMPREF9419_1035 [Prevotella nigrescens ATCC 33563]